MERHALADDLRAAQIRLGQIPTEVIRELPDEVIIDSYITCSCCGEKQVEGTDLDLLIASADDTEHFFKLAGNFSQIKHAISQSEQPRAQNPLRLRRGRNRR